MLAGPQRCCLWAGAASRGRACPVAQPLAPACSMRRPRAAAAAARSSSRCRLPSYVRLALRKGAAAEDAHGSCRRVGLSGPAAVECARVCGRACCRARRASSEEQEPEDDPGHEGARRPVVTPSNLSIQCVMMLLLACWLESYVQQARGGHPSRSPRAYCAGHTVRRVLWLMVKDGDLNLEPDYQRSFVWDRKKASRLVYTGKCSSPAAVSLRSACLPACRSTALCLPVHHACIRQAWSTVLPSWHPCLCSAARPHRAPDSAGAAAGRHLQRHGWQAAPGVPAVLLLRWACRLRMHACQTSLGSKHSRGRGGGARRLHSPSRSCSIAGRTPRANVACRAGAAGLATGAGVAGAGRGGMRLLLQWQALQRPEEGGAALVQSEVAPAAARGMPAAQTNPHQLIRGSGCAHRRSS